MPFRPKINADKMLKVLNAWKNIAPQKTYGGLTLEQFEAQVERSLSSRRRIKELDDQKIDEINRRESEDRITMAIVLAVVAGIIADPTEGPNSALYEASGYVRKNNRKTGLTRKSAAAKREKV